MTLNFVSSLAFVFLLGIAAEELCKRIHIPYIIGLLGVGIILGPSCLNLLDSSILLVSGQIRQVALIIILIKAGLALNIKDLKKVGRPAILMSFVPASIEIIAYTFVAPLFFGISHLEGAIMGSVLAAVSPAVVVPRMVTLIESQYGTKKGIPQMILAGASLDDVFVIVLFSTFCTMGTGGDIDLKAFADIPLSVILGIIAGCFAGLCLSLYFNYMNRKHKSVRNSLKVIYILGAAFLLMTMESWIKYVTNGFVHVSGLIAVISMACVVRIKIPRESTIYDLSAKFGKIWYAFELMLFVLVGAAVDIRYAFNAGWSVVIVIFIALAIRAVGVIIAVSGTHLNLGEKMFCVFSYMPKATVQAAIGSVPLAMGLDCGNIVLTVAVAAIIMTAPLGAVLMDSSYKKLLTKE